MNQNSALAIEQTVWETVDDCCAVVSAAAGAATASSHECGTLPTKEDAARESAPPWVLCVDDDPDYSVALRYRLEAHGVAVVRSFDGLDGYHTANSRPADAIILDYEMPKGCGDDVLLRLKENPATRHIPVIVVTGRKDRWLERKMIGLGAAAFLTKPLIFSELLGELRRHINILPKPALTCC